MTRLADLEGDARSFNGALSQDDRRASAPRPDLAPVDGRSLAERLAFAARYGALVRYYDLSDSPVGDWSAFFTADPVISAARLASLDLAAIEAQFERVLAGLRKAEGAVARRDHARRAMGALARLIRALDTAPAGRREFQTVLSRVIEADRDNRYAAALRELSDHLAAAADGSDSPFEGRRLSHAAYERFLAAIEAAIGGLLAQLFRDAAVARDTVDAGGATGVRAPQAALWHAFVELGEHAHATVNAFPARLVEFYGEAVLRQTTTPVSPDQVLLTLIPASGVTEASVPKGTLFAAGNDASGAAIQYAADTALTVTDAAVSALRILRLAPADPAAPGDAAQTPPAMLLSGVVALSGTPPSVATAFPAFGAPRPGAIGGLTMAPASLGFAVTSPTLTLAGGRRQIALGLTPTPASLAAITPMLEAIGKRAGGLAAPEVLAEVLQAAFALDYSSAGGWIAVPSCSVSPPAGGGSGAFVLTITLPASAAPVVGLSAKPPAKGVQPPAPGDPIADPDQPTLRAGLVQTAITVGQDGATATVHPYAILSGLELQALSLKVTVDGLADLGLTTPGGPASASQAFAPFGSPPVKTAALEIAAPELFVKTPTRLTLALTWAGLPTAATGFAGYYSGYVIDADGTTGLAGTLFDNARFTAELDVVSPGGWILPFGDPLYLFRTDAAGATPAPAAPLIKDVVLAAPSPLAQAIPAYYDATQSRLRLTLTGPDAAFGNSLYAPNVLAATLQDSAAAGACAQLCARQQSSARSKSAAAVADLQAAEVANAQTPDRTYTRVVTAQVNAALGALTSASVDEIKAGIVASGAHADTRAAWTRSLRAAETAPAPRASTASARLALPAFPVLSPSRADPGRVAAQLTAWITQNAGAMGPIAQADLNQAQAFLAAASGLAKALGASAGQSPTSARPAMAAAIQAALKAVSAAAETTLRQCIQNCLGSQAGAGLPNPPWLPMLSAISLGYEAQAALPDPSEALRFHHFTPFGGVETVDWPAGSAVPLLSPIAEDGALFIGLSAPAKTLTLLIRLQPGTGARPAGAPPVTWAQAMDGGWRALAPTGDTTDGLRATGIVSLSLAPWPDGAPCWLRLSQASGASDAPLIAGLTTNALSATWVGPGGADTRGEPLPPGTISKPALAIPGIAKVAQPLASVGGYPAATGAALQVWTGERLRHKGFGVQASDIARLALAAFPALWQVGVAPATDCAGASAPGHVWVVVVPGPGSPGLTDPTAPQADSTLLAAVSAWLAPKLSPFARLAVTNPPYVRVRATVEALFSDDDTVSACTARLNAELVAWLSPWPPAALGPRPDHYYQRHGIAEFIRRRPYVLALLSLSVRHDPEHPPGGWRYVTSAATHVLTGRTDARGAAS
jgi:hypothetical protein